MKHQILIASYQRDFIWLAHCLRSIRKFVHGFLPPSIVVPSQDEPEAKRLVAAHYSEAQVRVEDGPGMLRAQVVMLSGDVFCPGVDFVYLVGSDCMFCGEVNPKTYFNGKLPTMLYTSYAALGPSGQHWRKSTMEIMGFEPEHEYMRRLPLVYPSSLFPEVRLHISRRFNRKPFRDVVYKGGWPNYGYWSESNCLGAFAFKFRPHLYHWLLTDTAKSLPYSPMVQFWSHGGVDRPSDNGVEYLPGKIVAGNTPRQVITEVLGSF